MMHQISRNYGLPALRGDSNRYVSRRVSGSWLQPDIVGDAMAGLDQRVQTGIQNRLDRLFDQRWRPLLSRAVPVFPFQASGQVAGVRKSWHPFAIGEHGVPADVVHV